GIRGGRGPGGPVLWPVLAVVVAAAGGVGRRRQPGRRTDAAVRGRARRQCVRRRREWRAGAAHTAVDRGRRRLQVVVTAEPDRRGPGPGSGGGGPRGGRAAAPHPRRGRRTHATR